MTKAKFLAQLIVSLPVGLATTFAVAAPSHTTGSDQPAVTQAASAYTTLDKLNSENVLLRLQIENAKLRAKLAAVLSGKAQDATEGSTAQIGPMGGRPSFAQQSVAPITPARESGVVMVSTSPKVNHGAPTALIALPGGGQTTATVGTRVPGFGTVTSISVNEVLVRSKGQISSLPFLADTSGESAPRALPTGPFGIR